MTLTNSPIWFGIAGAELGVASHPQGSINQRIVEYHQGTNIEGYDDKVSWCSSFLNWSLDKAGIKGTGSVPIEHPVVGTASPCSGAKTRPVGRAMSATTSEKTTSTYTCLAAISSVRCVSTLISKPWCSVIAGLLRWSRHSISAVQTECFIAITP